MPGPCASVYNAVALPRTGSKKWSMTEIFSYSCLHNYIHAGSRISFSIILIDMASVVNLAKNFTSLGEGPHWDHVKQRLLFVDIDEAKIHRWDYATSNFATPIALEGKLSLFILEIVLSYGWKRRFFYVRSHCRSGSNKRERRSHCCSFA